VGKPKCLFGEDVPIIKNRPLKCIVFSQFRKFLNMAGDRMLRRFGTAGIAEFWEHYTTNQKCQIGTLFDTIRMNSVFFLRRILCRKTLLFGP
jgi:hypothetical protein